MSRPQRSLVLHADDFGFNSAVTKGIIEGFSAGLLTSTSLLANAPAAELAIHEWQRLEELRRSGNLHSTHTRRCLGDPGLPFDLGIHLNLTQGRPLTGGRFPRELLDSNGRFLPPARFFFKLLTSGRRWRQAIGVELAAQVEWLIARGFRPTHINGHQYVEMMPIVSELVPHLAHHYAVPYVRAACEPGHWRTSLRPGLRLLNGSLSFIKQYYAGRWRRTLDAAGIVHADAFFGASHAGQIDLNIVQRYLRLALNHVHTEIALHPGHSPSIQAADRQPDDWHDSLAYDRPAELRLVCSAALADLIAARGLALGRLRRSARDKWLAA